MSLYNQVALITGAASGIGQQCARKLSDEGAAVAIADLNYEGAKLVAKEINEKGGRAIAIAMDVTNETDVNKGVQECINRLGDLNVLVSNAGVQIVYPFEEYPFAEWKKMQAIHADGAFLTSKAAFSHMKKSGKGGRIIFMGSIHSYEASKLKAAYCFAKHGIVGLSKVLAKEGGPFGIYSYTICPGFVETPLVKKQIPEQAKNLKISEEEVIRNVMLKDTVDGEFTTIDEVAAMVSIAAQDLGAMSGQAFLVSHGWGMR